MSADLKQSRLADWRQRALAFEREVGKAVIGLERPIRHILIAVFARGHVMLEGDVGVGKTTLLRAVARCLGGAYERVEGTIDLMPNDLVYHTYINELGKPQVEPGPVLKHGEELSVFFFNEVNRARPQVHSLLLRIMAEHAVSAFNREHFFPYLQVFADRNRVEKEETFEIPSAARDRFMMELHVETPADPALRRALMFDPKFHDVDRLLDTLTPGILPYREIPQIAPVIQQSVTASETLQQYALDLWEATRRPADYGVKLEGIDMDRLILAGASARGVSMMMRAARVAAWLDGRDYLVPEDIHDVFRETIGHRVFFNPVYELRRTALIDELLHAIRQKVAAP
ncbi:MULTISPECIES: AAA family ATPase [Methylococcus]|uniref:Putative moxR protein n=1 Tax=Methylococcus capsulatus (strain ATCC 33009 / NCIMB 11132 / Bath) TaxID=243233 RepID=Q608G6_METCA|nr:MoxR family ATPase [Methylococcus capsulatus]AAU92243.1 putative moxR protein [Methylococcus capsulatus str. Bath]